MVSQAWWEAELILKAIS